MRDVDALAARHPIANEPPAAPTPERDPHTLRAIALGVATGLATFGLALAVTRLVR